MRVCVRAYMCTCHIWLSGCERTGCSPRYSSTLISVAVLVLGVQWNKSVRHLQHYVDVCSFLSTGPAFVCVCTAYEHAKQTYCWKAFPWGLQEVFFCSLHFFFFSTVRVRSGHACIRTIRQWKKTRARLCRRRSRVHALHTSWSTMRCTR